MSYTSETWIHVPDINCYISSYGQLKNCNGKILKVMKDKGQLCKINRRGKWYNIHELVANAFIKKAYNKYDDPIIHIDHNIQNNHADILKYKFIKHEKDTKAKGTYILSFKSHDGKFHVYHSETKKISVLDRLPGNISSFSMLTHEDNEATDEDLVAYVEKFEQWTNELLNNKIIMIDYKKAFSDYIAVTTNFNRLCKDKYIEHAPISAIEYSWMEKTPNCGMQYIDKRCIDVEKV